jgi:hypothetical protein
LLLIFYKFGGKSKCMYVENIFLVHYSPPIDVRTCMLICLLSNMPIYFQLFGSR